MKATADKPTSGFDRKSILFGAAAGIILGAAAAGLLIFSAMPSIMIATRESKLGFDETVAELEKSISEHGWVVSAVMDMNKSMAEHGVELAPRVGVIKLCNPHYAKEVLTTDRYIAALMPCSFAIWQGDDGRVYLSKMNMRLMAKMFGGNIEKVMGGSVAEDEQAILSGIVEN